MLPCQVTLQVLSTAATELAIMDDYTKSDTPAFGHLQQAAEAITDADTKKEAGSLVHTPQPLSPATNPIVAGTVSKKPTNVGESCAEVGETTFDRVKVDDAASVETEKTEDEDAAEKAAKAAVEKAAVVAEATEAASV